MVDCISECGYKSAMVNSYMVCKTNSKKIQFGATKCKKMHSGKNFEKFKCQPLCVDTWKEIETENSEIEDVCIGTELMKEKDDEKYLGDVISKEYSRKDE